LLPIAARFRSSTEPAFAAWRSAQFNEEGKAMKAFVPLVSMAFVLVSSAAIAEDEQKPDSIFSDSRVAQGFRIAPVPLNLRGKRHLLVGLGSYLVNAAGGCNDCHTRPSFLPGGDPYKGETPIVNADQYLTGGRQFGPVTSANITPDANGRPAGLTYEEFQQLIRTGRDPDAPDRILQVMPWPIYGHLTDLDLRAIYEYLRAIPSRPDNPTPGP
jgi:hypothetical protein